LWRKEGAATGDGNHNDSRNDRVNDSLSDSVNSTYQAIKANPGIQRKRISELTRKSIPTIDRHLAFLAKSNLIEHRDSDKTGGYYAK
jgi:predicted transcriptional regulator